jgi:hypothetical protein
MRHISWALTAVCLSGCTNLSEPGRSIGQDTATEGDLHDTRDTGEDTSEDTGEARHDTADTQDPDEEQTETGLQDDAQLVAVDLPTEMACDATYPASVEMRNTGLATWDYQDGYKLGAVNDEDSLYGPDVRVWIPEGVSVAPGETFVFEFDLTAPQATSDYLTDWQMVHEGVQWFGETTQETVSVSCGTLTYCDPLTDSVLQAGFSDKSVSGGRFTAAGWQTTGDNDQLLLAMNSPMSGDGVLEVEVSNFDPQSQYTGTKHQIINMYTSDNGSQDVFDTTEAWYNIRTGTNYGTGLKFLAAPNGGDSREEARLIESASWDPNDVHTLRVEWDATDVRLYLNGSELVSLGFAARVQPLQHIFLGTDNVYSAQIGPVYSNLCITHNP